MSEVLYERRGPLALITLNRPDKLNALTRPMIASVLAEARRAEADPEVYAICITGAGRGFCAGIDAEYLKETTEQGLAKADPNELPALFSGLLRISKPVISAVNGPAAGGGFILAMMSDLRFLAETAMLTTVFTKRGLIAEHGSSWLLPRIVGVSRALDLLWSSRRVDAAEALRIGLADRVVAPEALLTEVEAYAAPRRQHLAARPGGHQGPGLSPPALRHGRGLLGHRPADARDARPSGFPRRRGLLHRASPAAVRPLDRRSLTDEGRTGPLAARERN